MSDIVVSMTSFPKRILTIDKVLETVINQTVRPDKIILYLSSQEFEDSDAIQNLKKYEEYGFEIHWCDENLRSHKKWFYALQEYPDDLIITIDDDFLYGNTTLERLLKYHKIYPGAVIARRAHLVTCNEHGSIAPYIDWYGACSLYVGIPRMDLVATGAAGILYPPHILKKEIFNKDKFMQLCPYADDMWMKVMEVYSEIPVVLAEKTFEDEDIVEYQKDGLYAQHNGGGGNDSQLHALLNYYRHTYNGMELEKCLFSQGRVCSSDVKALKEEEIKRAMDELILKLCIYKKLFIYGAGMLGKRLHRLLKENNIKNTKAFIVNDTTGNPQYIDSKPVIQYKEAFGASGNIGEDAGIVIALLDKYESNKVYRRLIHEGVNKESFIVLNRLEKRALWELAEE